jgi:hypothetical protein
MDRKDVPIQSQLLSKVDAGWFLGLQSSTKPGSRKTERYSVELVFNMLPVRSQQK